MEIHFLGTGSAFPSPKRCSSCTAVRLDSGSVWLFDCGEGGQIQIQKSKIRPAKISAVFITHLHGDHIFGLPGMMCTISQAVEGQHLDVYGPMGLKNFLRCSLSLSFSNLSYSFTVHEIKLPDIQEFRENCDIEIDSEYWQKLSDFSKREFPPHPNEVDTNHIIEKNEEGFYHVCYMDRFNVYAADIKHTVPCLGYVLCEDNLPGKLDVTILKRKGVPAGPLYGKIKNGESITLDDGTVISPNDCLGPDRPGRKIVHLGDTHDPSAIGDLARGATILIHEATNENADFEKCLAHGHSTAGMAGKFACTIEAQKLILTHFSQRYSEEETNTILVQEAKETFGSDNVLAAADLMVVPVLLPR